MDSALSLLSAGSELSSTDRSTVEEAIEALTLSDEAKRLVRQMMEKSVRMTIPDVLAIWNIGQERSKSIPGLNSHIVWMEKGNDKAGYQHMLKHADEFKKLGINETELEEVAKAATTIGDLVGAQGGKRRVGPGRPIFLLIFKDTPLAVAISIGSNGFLVGMNGQDFGRYLKQGPPITKLGRYQSSNAEIIPGSAKFQGWVLRLVPAGVDSEHLDEHRIYEHHKNQEVTKTQETEPVGEWIYSESVVGELDREGHWFRKNLVTNVHEYWPLNVRDGGEVAGRQ